MRILGIDPGLERVGFGLIEANASQQYHALDWGVITTHKSEPEPARLFGIYDTLTKLIAETKPQMLAIEKLFFFRNATTIIPVTQARGVILMAFGQSGLTYREYTPMQVKLNVCGTGTAKKPDVQLMMQQIFNLPEIPRPDDAADALAIALSCAFESGPVQLNAIHCNTY